METEIELETWHTKHEQLSADTTAFFLRNSVFLHAQLSMISRGNFTTSLIVYDTS